METKEIEIESIEELDRNKMYHVAIGKETAPEAVTRFAEACRKYDLKVFITIGEFKFEPMMNVLNKLTKEQLEAVKDLLSDDLARPEFVIDPLEHEQTK